MRQLIKKIAKAILIGYVIKFIRQKLSGKSSNSSENQHK